MYRTIDAAFWTDPKVKLLSWSNRALLLYLITNPHTHISGIYYLPITIMAHEVGLSIKQVGYGIDTLSKAGFCRFDAERDIVWVKNMLRYQCNNDRTRISAKHHLEEDLHNSPLIDEFLAHYPEVAKLWPDRVSVGYPEKSGVATPNSPFPIPNSRSLTPDSRLLTPEQECSPPEKPVPAGRPRDLAMDGFCEKCLATKGTPYVIESGDAVMLAKLRKAFGTEPRARPPGWDGAVANYFASPLGSYSLADLANPKRYAVFSNSPLDEFNKQANRRNGRATKELYSDRIARENRETAALFGGDVDAIGDSLGTEDSAGTRRALLPRPK